MNFGIWKGFKKCLKPVSYILIHVLFETFILPASYILIHVLLFWIWKGTLVKSVWNSQLTSQSIYEFWNLKRFWKVLEFEKVLKSVWNSQLTSQSIYEFWIWKGFEKCWNLKRYSHFDQCMNFGIWKGFEKCLESAWKVFGICMKSVWNPNLTSWSNLTWAFWKRFLKRFWKVPFWTPVRSKS